MTEAAFTLTTLPPLMSPVTPFSMLCQAIARSADVPTLDRLIALHERWQAHEMRKAFESAMAAARAEIPIIIKNREVAVLGGRGSYRHEDLAEIARTIGPILAAHGLSYRFRTRTKGVTVTVSCVISHRDGYHEEISITAPADESGGKNSIQAVGSTLTYLQRMTLKAALGLAASEDDDGRRAVTQLPVNPEQIREILRLIKQVGADKTALLRIFKITHLPELPALKYHEACDLLRAKGAHS